MSDESTHISDPSSGDPTLSDPIGGGGQRSSQRETVSDPLVLLGKRIGNFEILSVLGRGGFGAVYKARDTKLARDVAIKFLHNPLDPSRRKLFEREARALAALSKHESIVGVYEWGTLGEQNYIVLEYVEGGTEKVLKGQPRGLPILQALGIAADCAEALNAAHTAGILHRDIKPANILLEPDTGRAKVADFGLARLAEESGEFTLAGGLSGSPPYMSPEQASSAELDGRSDIFSLGVTLYELLCGQRPFVGKSSSQIMDKIRRNDSVPITQHRPDLPDAIRKIVERATAHDPDDRYQKATDFAGDLRGAIAAFDDLEMADTRSVLKPAAAVRWGRPAQIALAAAIVAGGILLWGFLPEPEPPGPNGDVANPKVVLADARAAFEDQRYAEAREKLESIPDSAVPGEGLLVAAYLREIERRTQAEADEETMARARRLGEILRAGLANKSEWDGWTSRRLSFFPLPADIEGSAYVAEKGLDDVFDAALEVVYAQFDSMDFVDRQNLALITRELELSAELSAQDRGLIQGRIIGARLMVGANIQRLGSSAPEKLSLKVTDIETSKRIPSGELELQNQEPDVLLADLQFLLQETLDSAYPLQGRLYQKGGIAHINIGQDVGLAEGIQFEVRQDKNQRPLPDVRATVTAEPASMSAEVTLSGLSPEELPLTPETGWYVRVIEDEAAHEST